MLTGRIHRRSWRWDRSPSTFSFSIAWLLGRRPFPASVEMHALLERLAKQDALRMPLAPLDTAATAALAEDLLGRRPDRDLHRLVA